MMFFSTKVPSLLRAAYVELSSCQVIEMTNYEREKERHLFVFALISKPITLFQMITLF